MNDIFKLRKKTHYNLRGTVQFLVDPIHSVFNSSESRFGKKYPLTSKIKTLSSDLKKKSKSGNP